jgi:hypothetical protein
MIEPESTALAWLRLDEAECVRNIRERGIRRDGTAESFFASLEWAASYRSQRYHSVSGAISMSVRMKPPIPASLGALAPSWHQTFSSRSPNGRDQRCPGEGFDDVLHYKLATIPLMY